MLIQPHLTKIENWIGNKTVFEIILDRNKIETVVKGLEIMRCVNNTGHKTILNLCLYERAKSTKKAS